MGMIYLNGQYLQQEEAFVSVMDRGFLFGDGVYEVVAFYNDFGCGLEEHYERLEKSLDAVEIKNPFTFTTFNTVCKKLRKQYTEKTVMIYLQITRGAAEVRAHAFPAPEVEPTVFAYAQPFVSGSLSKGIRAITLEDIRWRDCEIKSLNLLPNVLASEYAKRRNAQEVIFFRDDKVTEGAISNVFVVKNGVITTTPLSPNILGGITRKLVLQFIHELKLPFVEAYIPLDALSDADEIWVSSSTREIVPVVAIDDKPIADGKPGALWKQIYTRYCEFVKEHS
jgi:D-alanine transaminase